MINNHRLILVLLILVATQQNTLLHNLPQYFQPKDEAEYVNYINIMLGNHQESNSLSENLQAIIQSERPSLLNAPSKVILLLAPTHQQNIQGKQLSLLGSELKQLIEKHKDIFTVQNLLNVDQKMIQQQIAKYQAKGMLVNVISGGEQEISALSGKLNQKKLVTSHRRILQGTVTTDNTYLIKFFFTILFIFVIIGCVGFIIQNDGKKDTLLYAKFIADVGAR